MLKRWCRRYGDIIAMALILFGFYGFSIKGIYGFVLFPDEFAYWSYAAKLCGYDWSDIVSLGSYFSYGYSLLLFPIFALCENAVTAYRIAVGMNFFLLFLAYVSLSKTMKELLPEKGNLIALFCALTLLFPGNLYYAQMTMTESLLLCLYVTAGCLLVRYLRNGKISTLILLLLTLIYSYTVHMRTIGIFLSVVAVLLLHIILCNGKKKHILIIITMAILTFVIGNSVKEQIMLNIYNGDISGLAAGNDYSGQLEKIRYIFTWSGFYDFIVSILGKILYLGLATYGLFYWGISALIVQIIKMLRNVRAHIAPTAKQQFALFLGVSALAEIGIATIYLLTLGEICDYTYGRYSMLIIPFIMVWGLVSLWQEKAKKIWIVTGITAAAQMAVTLMVIRQIINTGAEVFYGSFIVGIGYLYDGKNFSVDSFFLGAYLFGELLTLLTVLVILFCRSSRKKEYFAVSLVVLELALTVRAGSIYLEPSRKGAFRDGRLADKISTLQAENQQQKRVIYIDNSDLPFVGILQFMARDMDIQVMERKELPEDYDGSITENDIVIFAYNDEFMQKWTDKYAYWDVYGHFAIFYN